MDKSFLVISYRFRRRCILKFEQFDFGAAYKYPVFLLTYLLTYPVAKHEIKAILRCSCDCSESGPAGKICLPVFQNKEILSTP